MDSQTPYVYDTIQPNQIRLLRFIPTENGTALILEPFSLDEPIPSYRCLSYTWACPDRGMQKTWSLKVGSGHIRVLDSLQSFIQALRHKGKLFEGRWWIDFLCINQANLEERSQQVTHMKDIYHNAEEVVIWLGEESNDSNLAVNFIKMHDKFEQQGNSIEQIRKAFNGVGEYTAHWIALSNFLSRKWWSRIWTIQEFAVPLNIIFWVGLDEVSKLAVCRSIFIADKCTQSGIKETIAFRYGFNRKRAWDLYRADPKGVRSGRTLLALTAYFCFMDATDDRDRLYGLMALSTDGNTLLDVDYSLTCEEVYMKFAKAFITKHKSLDIICFAGIYSAASSSSLPSWVPDWHWRNAFHVTPLMVSQSHNKQIGNLRAPQSITDEPCVYYAASGNRPPTYEFQGSKLCVGGVILDTIDGIGGSANATFVQSSNNSIQASDKTAKPLSSTDILKSICKALVWDRKDRFLMFDMPAEEFFYDFIRLCAPLADPDSQTTVLPELREWFQRTASLQIYGRSFESILRDSSQTGIDFSGPSPNDDEYIQDSFIGRFFDTIIRLSTRLTVTASGRIGMVGEKAMKGDLVCILYGCSVPVLLRKLGDSDDFTFVGECFLDGCMDGSILEQEELAEKTFCVQ
ncbi:hypothetical protein COCVIDRAFT_26613 [Bipolaris victoriae FI3]|uniref:Heterokaryon incompatibility domain-containing protein n=1 Tax=Bipolaris victoriae (strain FI3) TaxID=930091 RepID=W7ESW6_BIPV3|nr:hypothetical protein COCVIDRAFT_26613 [Bipolaris victoriae FI3]